MISTMLFRLAILLLFISYSSVYAEQSQESIDSQNSHNYDDSEDAAASPTAEATTTAPCKDLISTCSVYAAYCNTQAYLPFLCQNCQQTCMFCNPLSQAMCSQYITTSTPCTDSPSFNCAQYAQYCSIPTYRSTVCKDCRATCGLCGSRYYDECVAPSTDPTCVDNTDCSGFVSLCNNPSNKQTMCSQCKKSCNFCAPNTYCN